MGISIEEVREGGRDNVNALLMSSHHGRYVSVEMRVGCVRWAWSGETTGGLFDSTDMTRGDGMVGE